jgi:hypothetical protein
VVGVLARLLVWLTLIKLYQQKSPRDYAQLLGLSLLLMLIGSTLSTGLLFAGVLLIYAVLGLYVLLLFQLYAAHERSRAARLESIPPGYRLLPSLQPIVGRRTALHLRALMATVAVTGLLASAALFVLFPRGYGKDFLQIMPYSREYRSGFDGDVDLIGGTRITESRQVVLRMKLTGPRLGLRPLLLRGAVLDRYLGGGRWAADNRGAPHRLETDLRGFTGLGDLEHGRTVTQEFEVLRPASVLFSVYVPVAVGTEQTASLVFDRRTKTLIHVDGDRDVLGGYTIRADPNPDDATLRALAGSAPAPESDALVATFRELDIACGNRLAALAHDILAQAGIEPAPATRDDPWTWRADAAGALTAFFRDTQNNNLSYDTDLSDVALPAQNGDERLRTDPIVHFLLESRRGHCEYFASALAALCNCSGIPARLVTGYVANELDDATGKYVIREWHAHAWVEVQVSPWRWQAFDPTPAAEHERKEGGAPETLAGRWRSLFGRFEARWADGFVAFDETAQDRLMNSLDWGWSEKLGAALHATRQWLAAVNRAFYFGPAGYIWMGIVALALVIAAIAIGMRMKRVTRLRATMSLAHLHGGAYHRMLRQLGFYLDMLEALDRAGQPKPPWQPPLHYAQALSPRHPEGASLIGRLTKLFYAARYGGRTLTRDELNDAQALVEELRGTLLQPGR